jgi:hypothetical protein
MKTNNSQWLRCALVALWGVFLALPGYADSLSYTDQHVIMKDDEKARSRRPERIEKPSIQLGNFKIEVPVLVSASPLAATSFSSEPTAPRPKSRQTLLTLTHGRALSASDEARFKELVADGTAEVWAPTDVHPYVVALMPSAHATESAVRSWLACDQGCENWVWVERGGSKQ